MQDNECLDAYEMTAQASAVNLADNQEIQGLLAEPRQRAPKDPREVLLSLVMPAYDGGPAMRRAARQVLSTSYPSCTELVVVDAGSLDGGDEQFERLSRDRLKVGRHSRNMGKGVALRTGVPLARGTHMLPVDADDGQPPALSVIVPTRNEADNIQPLLVGLADALADIDAEVLIVDDSDDATPEIARQAAMVSALPIRVHARPPGQRTGGLGGAVLVGLSEALGPVCVVMDADLQHPPELLETLLRVSRTGVDFVVASRYRDEGEAEGLGGWYRRAVSTLATRVAKQVLRPELAGISDPMSGFFLVRRSCLDLPLLHPQGFKLLLELLVHSSQASVAEVPYTFGVRHSGVSKAGTREGLTFLRRLTELRAQARRAPRRSRPQHVPAPSGAGGRGLRQAGSRGVK